jgi:hypothetical protein
MEIGEVGRRFFADSIECQFPLKLELKLWIIWKLVELIMIEQEAVSFSPSLSQFTSKNK